MFMANKKLRAVLILWLALFAPDVFSAEISDLNGSWVEELGPLEGVNAYYVSYRWGRALRILDITLEIDIEGSRMAVPADGLCVIAKTEKESDDTVLMEVFRIGDEDREYPILLKFHFDNPDRFWIEYPADTNLFMLKKEQRWHRLSGPPKKE
jgi:hypothetical protein